MNYQSAVIRTNRGLSVTGTRITLYQIMDYLKADWHPKLIQKWLDLSDRQIADVMNYINTHKDEIEDEYQLVLKQAEESRKYWQEYNREIFKNIADSHLNNHDPVWLKIQSRKAELGMT